MRVSKHDYVTAFDLEEIGRREIAMEHFDVVAIQDAAFGVIEFEIKEALIDAGIAIAPDRDHFVGVAVKDFANAHRVIVLRHPITRSVIKEITQMDNPIRFEIIDSFGDLLHRFQTAVSVR
jgi:hypothetical protein